MVIKQITATHVDYFEPIFYLQMVIDNNFVATHNFCLQIFNFHCYY